MQKAAALLVIGAIAFLVVGNLSILGMSAWVRSSTPQPAVSFRVPGVEHLGPVDEHVWRGSAPSPSGYAALAAEGFTTVVDLRAEENVAVDSDRLAALGLRLVRVPVRDGQAPSAARVAQFLDAAAASPGKVFVHCGAGVGRTGTMAAAWLVASGAEGPGAAMRRNLAVGPPSLEQLAFVRGLSDGESRRPGLAVTTLSRVLDSPRRLWSRFGV